MTYMNLQLCLNLPFCVQKVAVSTLYENRKKILARIFFFKFIYLSLMSGIGIWYLFMLNISCYICISDRYRKDVVTKS